MADLLDILQRRPPEPWAGGGKIPWDDPAFSARMLREHLSQAHDAASRRSERIDAQVRWLHEELLAGKPARILDLGCGPGLYLERLARLGHSCLGIDFSPASIEHARSAAESGALSCEYRHADLRDGSYGEGFDLATLIFGELNAFRPEEAAAILSEARRALAPGGALVLEVHDEASVRRLGEREPIWYTAPSGLFSDGPHLCLRESAWSHTERAAVDRYFVWESEGCQPSEYVNTLKAYSEGEYRELLSAAGFAEPRRFHSLDGDAPSQSDLFVLVSPRAADR